MKKFGLFFKENYRLLIQLTFFLYTLGIGARFYFYLEAINNGNFDVTKPYGVEAFLPISALLGLKQLVLTGIYDPIHPAALTILVAIIIMSMILKKSFCSHICPIGFVSEIVSRFSRGFKIHKFAHYPLIVLKYLILIFLLYFFVISMDLFSLQQFISSPYNKISDSKMMHFFTDPGIITISVVIATICLTLLFKNFWCRYLCPYGSLLGVLSLVSPFKVKRNKDECINCMKCSNACPMDIPVHDRTVVISPECMGCQNCVNNRYNEKCLTLRNFHSSSIVYSFIAVFIFLFIFAVAYFTGHWQSNVSNQEYYMILKSLK